MAGVRLPARLFGVESSGALVGVATLFLLLVHDALHALAQLFKRFTLLDKLEDRFQQRLRYVQVVHFLTSFCKSWLLCLHHHRFDDVIIPYPEALW